jgi:hypothetical protein
MAWLSEQAQAQTCPDHVDFDATAAADIVASEYEIAPHLGLRDFNNESCTDVSEPSWCSESFGYPPYGSANQRDKLFLWFPGKDSYPESTKFVPQIAAFAGYHVIDLAYDNPLSVSDWCSDSTDQPCNSGCQFVTAQEMLYGFDDSDTDYPGDPLHSIEGRLRMAIEDLHDMDVNDNGVVDHHWDDFCQETDASSPGPEPQWSVVEVGGWSFGSQMAAYISYLEPTSDAQATYTIGQFSVEGGAPVCGDWLNGPPNVDYYPDEMDEHLDYPPCGEVSECRARNRFSVLHLNGSIQPKLSNADTALEQMNFDVSDIYDFDSDLPSSVDFDGRNVLRSDADPANGGSGHGAVALDASMPNDLGSGLVAANASDFVLMPAYLSAICQLDDD